MRDSGKCFLVFVIDSPGHVEKKPFCIAAHHVERTGYPAAACKNAMWSCAVFTVRVLIAKFSVGVLVMFVRCSGMVQRPLGVRVPWEIICVSRAMVTVCLLNVVMHPASQN